VYVVKNKYEISFTGPNVKKPSQFPAKGFIVYKLKYCAYSDYFLYNSLYKANSAGVAFILALLRLNFSRLLK